ncbi:hypothetical protein BYT27DRAFT_7198734 [Phlegmacium glaucopus]|nr:hypothetical protein BYT27DRAFT_7198734 [Phlegmacium glaucopus]
MAAIQEPRNVKIERRYRFAGEEVVEVVEVPEDSPEAKKWPLWKESLTESSTEAEVSSLPLVPAPSILVTAPSNPSSPPAQMSSPTIPLEPASTSVSTKPPLRKPGPRKPKTSLTPLPGPSSKSKKLSTLDKSAMDWQAHVHAEQHSGLKDELEANRKTGGYLEKVQFLKRVEERKDETLEVLKSNKRRKL